MLLNQQVLILEWTFKSALLLSFRLFPQYSIFPYQQHYTITPMVHTTILSITDLLNLATDTFFKQDAYYNKLHYTSWCFCLEFTQQFFAKFSNAKCHEKLSIVR